MTAVLNRWWAGSGGAGKSGRRKLTAFLRLAGAAAALVVQLAVPARVLAATDYPLSHPAGKPQNPSAAYDTTAMNLWVDGLENTFTAVWAVPPGVGYYSSDSAQVVVNPAPSDVRQVRVLVLGAETFVVNVDGVIARRFTGTGSATWFNVAIPVGQSVGRVWVTVESGTSVELYEVEYLRVPIGTETPGQVVTVPPAPAPDPTPSPTPDPTPNPSTDFGSMVIAPKYVTWDGLMVSVIAGTASKVYYSFPEEGSTEYLSDCVDVAAGDSCQVASTMHAGKVIRVRAVMLDASGTAVSQRTFEVRLAVHVELGKYSFQLLEEILAAIKALPEQIAKALGDNLKIDMDGQGYKDLQSSIDALKAAGVFGQVNQAHDSVAGAISDITAPGNRPDPSGPRTAGPHMTGDESARIPCSPGEQLKLSFCIPMKIGMAGADGSQETFYFRMDLPNHVRDYSTSYAELWSVIRTAIYIGFVIWLIRQFTPSLQT